MRSGDQLRVHAQLLEAPAGTVLWSSTFQASIENLFDLQDALTRQIVESLAVPLSARESDALRHDAPASAKAYEFYLRANQVAYDARHWETARDLYRKCLELDPTYAPAWARLGRLYRAISIYTGDYEKNNALAQEAFRKALELNPDLSMAHNLYTYAEVEMGRAQDAMLRLLGRARYRMHDPELFAGLVQACRYCGLLDESIAAYERARRIDAGIRTSVAHAYMMRGDYDRAIAVDLDNPPFMTILALELSGRVEEALTIVREKEAARLPRLSHDFMVAIRTMIEGRFDEARPTIDRLLADWRSPDPCAAYYITRQVARLGDNERALASLLRVVENGFFVPSFMARDPYLDSLRGEPEFQRIVHRAEQRYLEARRAFVTAGGDRILGLET